MAKIDNFLKEEKADIKIKYKETRPYFAGEKDSRDVYDVQVSNDGEKVNYTFGQSIFDSEKGVEPTKDDVLYALAMEKMTAENSNNYKDFISEYGYEDNAQSKKIYRGVQKNAEKYDKVFNDNQQQKISDIYGDY